MTAEFCTMELQEILNVVCDQCPGVNCKNCTYEQVINYASKCIRYVEEKECDELMNNQSLYGLLYVCRNCKHYKIPERYSKKYYCCRKALVKVMPSDFCSYFEMKEGETE